MSTPGPKFNPDEIVEGDVDIPPDECKYKIQTTTNEKSGTVTTTLWFENPTEEMGKKLHQISFQVMKTKEESVAKGLQKIGWRNPQQVLEMGEKYLKEVERLQNELEFYKKQLTLAQDSAIKAQDIISEYERVYHIPPALRER